MIIVDDPQPPGTRWRSWMRWALIYDGWCPNCLAALDFRLTCKACKFDADDEPASEGAAMLDDPEWWK